MRNDNPERAHTEVELHQESRTLSVEFSNGEHFGLPCEYLRVFSPAAEVRAARRSVIGKEDVSIAGVEPVGHGAVRAVLAAAGGRVTAPGRGGSSQ